MKIATMSKALSFMHQWGELALAAKTQRLPRRSHVLPKETRKMLLHASPLLKDRLINVKWQSPRAAERRDPPHFADVTFHANFGAVHYRPEKISKTDFQMQHLTIYHLIVIGELNGFFWGGGRL